MHFLLVVQMASERIEALVPEPLVIGEPHGGILQRPRRELATHGAAFLLADDQPGILEHPQVLHEAGQRHVVRGGELGDAQAARLEAAQHVAPRGVGEGGEHEVELGV